MVRVCVIGAGVVGLTTAWRVTEQLKNASVVVYAEKFTTETTSHGAAGIFCPQLSVTNAQNFDQICADSWTFFNGIVKSSEARNAGISVVDGYQLNTEPASLDEENYRKFVYHFSPVPVDSLTFLPDTLNICQAFHYTTLLIECRRFLPWMMKKLEQKGVQFCRRFVLNFDELASEHFDLIFNCAGLGNEQLVGDIRMCPVRGQVIRVHAPWVKQFFIYDDYTYIFPGQDLVVLGGCAQRGNYNIKVDSTDTVSIWNRCKRIIPSIAGAVVDHEWVGLRPYRDEVRIEDGGYIVDPVTNHISHVIHNYGHGSNGVGLSMGSACAAVSLASNLLSKL